MSKQFRVGDTVCLVNLDGGNVYQFLTSKANTVGNIGMIHELLGRGYTVKWNNGTDEYYTDRNLAAVDYEDNKQPRCIDE